MNKYLLGTVLSTYIFKSIEMKKKLTNILGVEQNSELSYPHVKLEKQWTFKKVK